MAVTVPDEFLQFLRSEQARGYDTTLEDARATSLSFYQGKPYGDEVEGRSQAVTRDVAEVVDTSLVGILNTVLASGKAVEFESEPEQATDEQGQPATKPAPPGPDGQSGEPQPVMVDYGEEATAAVRYHFMRKQSGYRILHDALKAGKLEKTGIAKTFAEPQPTKQEQRQVLVDEMAEDGEGYTVEGLRVIDAQPGADDPAVWVVTVEVPQPPVFRDVAVPNEYFRVSPDADSLDGAVYVGDRSQKSISDLVKLGYDLTLLETLNGAGSGGETVEKARDADRSNGKDSIGRRTGANKMLWLEEEYPLYDLNGDGIAERLFVHRVGNVVLNVMEVDEQPYSIWSPFPAQHRLVGDSTADKTMDIQRIRSVLLRSGLDSLYLSTAPRTLVAEEAMTVDTIDDLLTVRPGGLIRYKGGSAPSALQQQDTSALAFQGMEMMSSERESRTGVTRQSQGLNPDTMNKTAAGMGMLMAQSQQIELYITRNFVELLVASMFAKRYRLMRKYGQPFRMKIEGKYRLIDPRKWPEEIDMNINVGIGTGNKDQKIALRRELFQVQQGIVQAGGRIVGEEQVYQNVRGFVQDSGLGSPSDYVLNPADLGPAPEKPDPEAAKVQADAQTQQAKDQQAHELALGRLSLQQQEGEAKNQLAARQQEFDLAAAQEREAQRSQLERDRATFEAGLAQDRQSFDMRLAIDRMEFDQELARRKASASNDDTGALPALRPGGDLDK
jgi:hypothetical protein